jgi:hypothetical protein
LRGVAYRREMMNDGSIGLLLIMLGWIGCFAWFFWCLDRRAVSKFVEAEQKWEEEQAELRRRELKPGEWNPGEWKTAGKRQNV